MRNVGCLRFAVVLVAAMAASVSRASEATVFVPDLWDTAQAPPKPDLAGLAPLRIITGEDNPPFDEPGTAGAPAPAGATPAGFNVELARAICNVLDVTCTVQARRWDTIVPALETGAGDMAVASQSITPAAMRVVDFTSPYYRTPARFVMRLGADPAEVSTATLKGKRVGVEAGTAHAAYLQAFFPGVVLVPYRAVADLRAALQAGTLDAVFGDGIGWSQWLNGPAGRACCGFVGGPFTESYFFGEGAGIAVRKGRGDLRRAVDYALWRLAADGTYADLWLKFFPIDPY